MGLLPTIRMLGYPVSATELAAVTGWSRDRVWGALRTLHANRFVAKAKNKKVVLWSATAAGRRAA